MYKTLKGIYVKITKGSYEVLSMKKIIPGLSLAILLAFFAKFVEAIMPVHWIGASLVALLLGIFIKVQPAYEKGIDFASKNVLKFAIILLGATLNIAIIVDVGRLSMAVMLFTLLTCFGAGYFIGKAFGLNWKLSNLISAGTGICGGSAIAAVGAVIEADDEDIAVAMSATFIFDIAMIILFPIMGRLMNMSDLAFGLWAGTAVNDTSSVVAASYAFSQGAGDIATMVKLVRTLAIIPTVLIFSLVHHKTQKQSTKVQGENFRLTSLFPWFILAFVGMSVLRSVNIIPAQVAQYFKITSQFLMVVALAAIGLKTNFGAMKKSGMKPMLHGFIISLLVVLVALLVQYSMGIL